MKKYILIFILLPGSFLFVVGQNVFTLDGSAGTRAYSSIDSALKYAQDGDYLYLPGATINIPGGFMVKKRLNIIGAGHYPDSTIATGTTVIAGNLHFFPESSGSMLQGIYTSGSIYMGLEAASANVKNMMFSRCNVNSLHLSHDGTTFTNAENIVIRECIIRGDIAAARAKNVLAENCIIDGGINSADGQTIVRNCIFMRVISFGVNSNAGTRFENNIFMANAGFWGGSNSNLQFYNNIFREGDPLGGPSPLYVNNKFSVTNLFVNAPAGGFSYAGNYHLNSDSPAKNAGLDGKDCGVYGGANPYKEGAVPVNPHIRVKTLPAQTDAQGKINVQVTVAAQNN
jgi:hypothetical protein